MKNLKRLKKNRDYNSFKNSLEIKDNKSKGREHKHLKNKLKRQRYKIYKIKVSILKSQTLQLN